MRKKILFALSLLSFAFYNFVSSEFVLAQSPDERAQANECTMDAYYDALGQSESGGCGGGNQYNCQGPVITSGMHAGDRPLGKYQFMPKTLIGMGIDPSTFVGNAAAQEAAIRQYVADTDACLQSQGAYAHLGKTISGVTITKSCLLGAAHLGGCGGASNWVNSGGGAGPSDQLGTSLADYCAKFGGYGDGLTECGGGVPNAADIFGQSNQLIGCDPSVLEGAQDRVDALKQQEIEAAKAIITQPTPVEQLTCLDQHTEVINAAGGIHSKPGGNISDTVGPLVQQPLQNTLQQFMNGNIAGSIMSTINNAFANVTQQFQSMLGGLGGGLGGGGISAPNTNCDMQQQAWLISQCIEMPTLPSLGDILGGKIGEALGKVNELGQLIQSPERMLQKVCDKANSKLQDTLGGAFGDIEGAFDKAADSASKPVVDSINVLGN